MSDIDYIGETKTIDVLKKKKGMQIYLPLADKGIDFIAGKGTHIYQIQVKTSMFHKSTFFWFRLFNKKMVYSKNTFYIFVALPLNRRQFMGKVENYFVVSSLEIKKWISEKKIASKEGDDNIFDLYIFSDRENKKWLYKNKGKQLDWTKYWNNFSCFE